MTHVTLTLALFAGSVVGWTTHVTADEVEAPVAEVAPVVEEQVQPVVQIALLLDTSNSMDGLIDQAKSELWSIVNELALAKHEGQTRPRLQIALYEYGNNSLNVENGWVRQVQPLTDNLDQISQDLFALSTNGGEEYCGRVIGNAVNELTWSTNNDDLKAIFIAGNEPFTQGQVNWQEACSSAISRGITVNTIFCGPEQAGIDGGWQHGALHSDGHFVSINQDQETIHVDAPQDKEIARLGLALNETYIPFGAEGQRGWLNQMEADADALEFSDGANLARQACKAGAMYSNSRWDLVDACKDGTVVLSEVEEEDLPENMQSMTEDERTEYVEGMQSRRADLQQQIQTLSVERNAYIADERKRLLEERGEESLDSAIVSIIRNLAEQLDYQFE